MGVIDYGKYQRILIEKKDGVGIATLNRPEALNAFDERMHLELEELFADVGRDEDVKALILTGAGKAFSSGGDIKLMKLFENDPSYTLRRMVGSRVLLDNVLDFPKPFIAAINGPAAGVAATVGLLADIIFMSERAWIADTHVKVGLVAGDGGALVWPMLIGVHRAKEFLLTGDRVDAKTAERIGLVNRVVAEKDLIPASLEFAGRLAKGATMAIQLTKAAINKKIKSDLNLLIDNSLGWESLTFFTGDHKEAVKAFSEKRDPRFQGK